MMEEEEEKYRRLLNQEDYSIDPDDPLAAFLNKAENAKLPPGKGKQNIWKEIDKQSKEEKSISLNPWMLGGIAAAIAFLVVFFITNRDPVEASNIIAVANTSEKNIEHILPDSSVVTLNKSTSITYRKEWNRLVELEGEAFFQVTKGSTFTVETALGSVEVLGTSFNVYARKNAFEVACKTGKVLVKAEKIEEKITLDPGQKVQLKEQKLIREKLPAEEIANWTTGEFFFDNKKLSEVWSAIERQYNVKLIVNAEEDYYSGYFSAGMTIEETLEVVCLPLSLTYKQMNDSTFAIEDSK